MKGLLTLLLVGLSVTAPMAQISGTPAPGYRRESGMPASAVPRPLREIGFDQHLDEQVPLDAVFRDESGREVRLGEYFGRRPVVLVFVYYDCPLLCTQVIGGLSTAVRLISLTPGQDFEVVAVSFNPADSPAVAAAKKAQALSHPGSGPASAWHFLTGEPESIAAVTKAAGFRYTWDEETRQFAHPTGAVVLTPGGRFSRYLFGIEYSPRSLQLALVESATGQIGSMADQLLLYCYHYDPTTGRYGLAIMRVLRVAGAVTVSALGALIVVMVRRQTRA